MKPTKKTLTPLFLLPNLHGDTAETLAQCGRL